MWGFFYVFKEAINCIDKLQSYKLIKTKQNKKNLEETRKLKSDFSYTDNRKDRIVRDELTKFDSELSMIQGLARIGK